MTFDTKLATQYLEGNPIKVVSLLSPNATPDNSPKIVNGSEREQILLADPLTGEILDLQHGGGGGPSASDVTPVANSGTGTPGVATAYSRGDHVHPVGGGIPIAVNSGTTLANTTHNGNNLILTGTPALNLPSGLMAGFGCGLDGTFTLAGGLTIGGGVTDKRATTGTAWCCLVQTLANGTTYDLVGTK